jgi:hypothetical protein
MLTFQSFTTVYDVAEDRIRLTGVSATGEVLSLWFTQRLLNSLIPRLCAALEAGVAAQPGAAAMPDHKPAPANRLEQEFVQRRAQMVMRPAAPVSPPPELDAVLVAVMQLNIGPRAIAVRFRDAQDAPLAEVVLRVTQMRQWLAILHRLYVRAKWPPDPWPAWFARAQIEKAPPAERLH